jgi:hypothetical protein
MGDPGMPRQGDSSSTNLMIATMLVITKMIEPAVVDRQ